MDSFSNPHTQEVNNSTALLLYRNSIQQTSIARSRTVRNGEKVELKIHEVVTNEDGMTTAEYAVGTMAAAGLGGLLLKLLTSADVQDLIWKIIQQAFSFLFLS